MISKLDPRYTLDLRGFDDRGAGASLHHVTGSSFKVSGVHRDSADFTVLKIWSRDNFYEHPRLKYLPDDDFSGVVLTFDARYDAGLIPFDSAKFATIAWDVLSVTQSDGTPRTIKLFDGSATQQGGTYTKASVTFTVATPGAVIFDRVVLWYNNIAFDYIASGGESASDVAAALVSQINGFSWPPGDQAIEAVQSGVSVIVRAKKPGADGNRIRLYSHSKNANLTLLCGGVAHGQMTGGSSDATWRRTIDFGAIWAANGWGAPNIREMWFTFAPSLPDAAAFDDVAGQEFEATFTNWTVTGAGKGLQVAGPGSVRVEETDAWCTYSGSSWGSEVGGRYSKGFARRAVTLGDKVTVKYWCQFPHDLYVGTSLYSDRGGWICTLDGDAATVLDCRQGTVSEPSVETRRRIRTAVPAGEHEVVLEANGSGPVYFDFLEAAVLADEPAAPVVEYLDRAPACDYGTDHTYKNSPVRILWGMDSLGLKGPLNVYVSVFWWNQRKLQGRVTPAAVVDFTQETWAAGDAAFVNIGGQVFGKSVFPADTVATIARHFTYFINQTSVGVWAEDDGAGVLTMHLRAVGAAYSFPFTVTKEASGGGSVNLSFTGLLSGGTYGKWVIDPGQTPTINRGSREWIADLCAECAARGRELTLAYSMELLDPPDDPGAGEVWTSRYLDGDPVVTATQFGGNFTVHCTFSDKMLAYHKRVYMETAGIMAAAGLDVRLQVGEFLWWFFPDTGPFGTKGMAFYDEYTKAQAAIALGRPLANFHTPVDDPGVNGGADVAFLAGLLVNYIAAIRAHVKGTYPGALIEILLPYDVNYPSRIGVNNLGGRLNYAVNIPPAFLDPAVAPFDVVKMEALDWQVGSRNQNLAVETMRLPYAAGTWPKSKVRFLCGLFNGGAPWTRAADRARIEGLVVNYWAWDHVCFLGWDLGDELAGSLPES